jgi:hypothetical protein
VNADLFFQYSVGFLDFLEERGLLAGNDNNIVLLDLHNSHLFNLQYLLLMREKGVKVYSFPPHCTHLLQPLDDSPFANLKRVWGVKMGKWSKEQLGGRVSKVQILSTMLPSVWSEAMTPQTILSGFVNTGIYPFNPRANKLMRVGPSRSFTSKLCFYTVV